MFFASFQLRSQICFWKPLAVRVSEMYRLADLFIIYNANVDKCKKNIGWIKCEAKKQF
jgi:hypothetical protein